MVIIFSFVLRSASGFVPLVEQLLPGAGLTGSLSPGIPAEVFRHRGQWNFSGGILSVRTQVRPSGCLLPEPTDVPPP